MYKSLLISQLSHIIPYYWSTILSINHITFPTFHSFKTTATRHQDHADQQGIWVQTWRGRRFNLLQEDYNDYVIINLLRCPIGIYYAKYGKLT